MQSSLAKWSGRRRSWLFKRTLIVGAIAIAIAPAARALPPVPVPPQNPITESKRVLGKILFWDEQLSSNNTVACGSCHQPRYGGTDSRAERGPGPDGKLGTDDDVFTSPGIVHLNRNGVAVPDKVFGRGPQAGTRTAPSFFNVLWADDVFWDGRATSRFVGPLSGKTVIPHGGALESQAVAPIMNPAEMAKDGRQWSEVARKLAYVQPLALARHLPPDAAAAIRQHDSYPQLFAAAFGDPRITPVRIAFAIATYERTLVADQTPFDDWKGRGKPPPPGAQADFAVFQYYHCDACHTPPLFTNDQFRNIGLRPAPADLGRETVSGDPADGGRMKVPSLRDVALMKRFTHTGELTSLDQVLDLYDTPKAPRDTLPDGSTYAPQIASGDRAALEDFIVNMLTDPRVAHETYPFDRPQLRSERVVAGAGPPGAPAAVRVSFLPGRRVRLDWQAPAGAGEVDDYRVSRGAKVVAYVTQPHFAGHDALFGPVYRFRIAARNAAAVASVPVALWVVTPWAWIWLVGGLMVFAGGGYGASRLRACRRTEAARPHR